MPHVSAQRTVPYTSEQMFDLVADVRRYPEFLPWVIGMRVRSQSDTAIEADMLVGFQSLRDTLPSHISLDRPHAIEVRSAHGPLRHLDFDWSFEPAGDGQCHVGFTATFEFRNPVVSMFAAPLLDAAMHDMIAAFIRQAAVRYPASAAISSSSLI